MLNISHYMKKFDDATEDYENLLTEKAGKVSNLGKDMQKGLKDREIAPFCYNWEEGCGDDYKVACIGLRWDGSKILFVFEDDAEPLLGTNRAVRVDVSKNFASFLNKGINLINDKTSKMK